MASTRASVAVGSIGDRIGDMVVADPRYGTTSRVYTIEHGRAQRRVDPRRLRFEHEVDPHGLLNLGKMRDYGVGRHGAAAA